ncbi:RCC1 and BTB domain-containing protein 1-like isoform X1 [Nomia melanderi]|uniref:RCC1 and BTB domain-containing protein 1-like isoform X1 n=2 Tax=Nomia melanderi TaxID=2448451 RepID=UPI003FCC4EE4
MIPSEFVKWRIFNLLEPEFIANIRLVFVYGNSGEKSLIVTEDDMVYILGNNTNRCLAIDDIRGIHYPKRVPALCGKGIKTFVQSRGSYFFALTNNGKVYFWNNTSIVLVEHLNFKFVVNIACGYHYALVLTETGEVYQLSINVKGAKCILSKNIFISISCGHAFSMAVAENGEVYTFRVDIPGQQDPHAVIGFNGIRIEKVVCGYDHTLALSNKGDLYVWGENKYGQLGLGTRYSTRTPVLLKIPNVDRVLDIAASCCNYISVAVGEHNDIFIWGLCLGQAILTPLLTSLKNVHDVFACYATTKVMHQPLILSDVKAEKDLMDCLKEAFDDSTTSDLTIQVEGQPIYVHKAMLKIRSQYFKTMFQDHWIENNKSVIECSEYPYKVYRAFLKYLYTDEIDLSADEETGVLELLELANRYCDIQLQKRCIQIIKESITVFNVPVLYSIAKQYNFPELEEYCLKYAIDHMAVLIQASRFSELREDMMKTFLIKAAEASTSKK